MTERIARDNCIRQRRDRDPGHQSAARDSARHGDVRARGRHIADERLDLGGRPRSPYDGQRGPVRDRARGTRVRRLHPDRQQGRRSDRSQTGVRPRPARLRGRRAGDGAGPEPDRDHRLLGDRRGPRRLFAPARDAVADPRQLRRRCSEEGVCARRGGGRDRRCGRTAARRFRHHVLVVARRVPARGPGDHRRPVRHQARPGRSVHGVPPHRRGRGRPVRARDGRRRGRDPGVAGRRRVSGGAAGGRPGRPGRPGLLARAPQARGQAGADRPRSVQVAALQARDHRSDDAADRTRRDDDRPASVPPDGARVQRPGGRRVTRPAFVEHVRGGVAGGEQSGQAAPRRHHPRRIRPPRHRGRRC